MSDHHVDFESAVRLHNQKQAAHHMDEEQAARVAADDAHAQGAANDRAAAQAHAAAAMDAEQVCLASVGRRGGNPDRSTPLPSAPS